jgi:hypothetical protein
MKLIAKTEARKLLKGVKSSQWEHKVSDIKGSATYVEITQVLKSTDKALFISIPSDPECKDGFWMPKSVCRFELIQNTDDKVRISVQMPYRFTKQGKEEIKNSGISRDNAIANFITRTGGDVYCTA